MSATVVFHIALFLFFTALFLWFIYNSKFFEVNINRKYLAFFFLLKVIAGIVLTLVYTYYYTDHAKADIYRYFNDSKIISSLLFTHPVVWLKAMTGIGLHDANVFVYLLPTQYFSHPGSDLVTNNSFIIRIISVLNYFSFYNIYTDTLFFDLISFVGLVLLFKVLRKYSQNVQALLIVVLFLMPSLVFWGSGSLKEGLVIFGLGIYLRYAIEWGRSGKVINVLWIIIGLLIVAWLKIHIAILLVLCSVFLPLPISPIKRASIVAFVIVIGVWLTGSHFCGQLIDKRNAFIALSISENAGSAIHSEFTAPGCSNLLKLLPSALVDSVVRPFLWEKGKVFQRIFALENAIVLLSFVFLLLKYFQFPKGEKRNLMFFCLSFSLLNYLVIGITVPVLGAIVHYRVIAQIFLFVGVLLCLNDKTIIQIKKMQI